MPNETTGGRLLARRYRLQTHVGRGGMGTVWQAHDEVLGRDVAVKEVILPHGLTDEERAVHHKRTFREARTAARLGHPGVVTVYDVVEEDGRPWIIMELIHARSLDQVIKQDGPMEVRRAADLGRQMLAALHAAHDAGVLHRDVKPSNVLVTGAVPHGERAVITDFGIATAAGDATLTQTGLVMGSPAYIAPERARGRTAGPASDLWSLGVTLYAMLHGRSPFERNEPMAALVAVISEEPDPPDRAGRLRPVIEGLLRKNPDERMDAREAGALLDDIVRRETIDDQRTLAVEVPSDEIPAVTPAPSPDPAPAERTTAAPSGGAWPVGEETQAPARPRRGLAAPSRNVLLVGVIAVVLIIAVASVVYASTRPDDDPPRANTPTSAPPSSPKAAPSTTPPTSPSATPSSSPTGVPAGFRLHKDRTGYQVAVPDGWSGPERRDAQNHFFRSPDRRTYIQIGQTDNPNPSALKDWQQYEPTGKRRFSGYRLIKIEPVEKGEPVSDPSGAKSADWEWTYSGNGGRMRALNRGFVQNGHGYAILLSAPADDWDKTLADLDPVYRLFKPADD
ncbi:serine/threonine-protein kinase [Actinomadura flavalba]|uniref:serine/threonine-protein kinase n=1 Tax=Actinomadura flavalba TaxID=1120938 RepID=UPI000475BFA4|nr:serine/threonine-protein kinase [Actinomadura flavalba]